MRSVWGRVGATTTLACWKSWAAFGLGTLTLASGLIASASPSAQASTKYPGIPAGPIKLGALLTMTGPFAAYGEAEQATYGALVANLNAEGGIAGHQIDLVIKNDQGNPTIAVQLAEGLAHSGVAGIVYAGTAATEFQTIPVFIKNKVPVVMLDPDDHWANGKAYPYMFTVYPGNKPTMKYMAVFAKKLGITKLGIIDDSSTFATTLEADFKPAAKAIGLPIVTDVSYSETSVDVTTQVRQLQAAGVNGVAVIAEGGLQYVWTAMHQIGWSPKIVTTAAAGIEGFSALGSLGANAYENCSVALKPGQTSVPGDNKVMELTQAKLGVSPANSADLEYNDVLLIFKRAIQQADSLNGTKIRNAIQDIHNVGFTSPEYRYTFTASQHAGWPTSGISMCGLSKFGPDDLGYIATP